MRQQQLNAEYEGSTDSPLQGLPSTSTSTGKTTILPPTSEREQDKSSSTADNEREKEGVGIASVVGPRLGQGDPSRMVTCMRCQESMPFLLVPSHGPKCKGKKESETKHPAGEAKAAAPPPPSPPPPLVPSERKEPFSGFCDLPPKAAKSEDPRSNTLAVAQEAADGMSSSWERRSGQSPSSRSVISPKSPPALPSSSDLRISSSFPTRLGAPLSPPAVGTKAWHTAFRAGASAEHQAEGSTTVPVSPSRPKDVRAWGTRQVTSWLREIMRPPRADVISKFHDGGVVGTTLLGLTDRCTDCTPRCCSSMRLNLPRSKLLRDRGSFRRS